MVVISPARSPIPSPSAPAPRLIAGDQSANGNPRSERDQGGANNRASARPRIDNRRIVLRHINHLRIRRLNHINGLAWRLLYLHRLLRVASQRPSSISLCAQPLNGVRDGGLIVRERLTDGRVVVDVLSHHLEDLRKIHKSDERRIESLLLRRVGERGSR